MSLRVLLIIPEFYGLEKRIKLLLSKSGYDVVWIENKTIPLDYKGKEAKFKLLRRIYFFLFSPRHCYINKSLRKIDNLKFDLLFSINCHIICPYLIKRLKRYNPDLLSILYLWDSFSKYAWEDDLILFNKVFTFDRVDSERHKIEYKPNFYISQAENSLSEIAADLSFVGKFTPERFRLIESLSKQIENIDIKSIFFLWPAYKIFLHNLLFYHILKHVRFKSTWADNFILTYEANEMKLGKDFIKRDKMGFEEANKNLMYSNVVLDLPFTSQSGYTHSLIKALATGKKVITSNSRISSEAFYNSDQIHILDTDNPLIDIEWIREKKEFPVDNYFSQLELNEWLKSIFNDRVA